MSKMIISLMMVAVANSSPLKVEQTKAASPYVNIGCQCSPLTFQDQYGAIQVRRLSVQHCLSNTVCTTLSVQHCLSNTVCITMSAAG